jgi:2,3-bisphosphoglycerate-independent phosphoglycerate mutase
MVGHTGDLAAAVAAVGAVDLCLGRLLARIRALGGVAIVTADHGNADQMFERNKKTGAIARDARGAPQPLTSHTLNPVPLTIFDPGFAGEYELDPRVAAPGLSNVAATALWLMGYEPPPGFDPPLVRPR